MSGVYHAVMALHTRRRDGMFDDAVRYNAFWREDKHH